MTRSATIAAARAAVAEKAALYTPKQTVHWITVQGENGDIEEDEGGDYFCEDCIEGAVAALNAASENGVARYSYLGYDMPEEESFARCEKCGDNIDCSMLWSKQEVGHWLLHEGKDWHRVLSTPSACWELAQLLDEHYGAGEDFPQEVMRIAERVLAANQAAIDLF